jgi:uncharacterized protein (TIGR02266 family)
MFEKRRHFRVVRNLKVTWRNQEIEFRSFTRDICAGGVFVITSHPVHPKEVLELELTSNGAESSIRCVGKVIWVNRGQVESFPPGFGVEILDIDDHSLESLLGCCEDMEQGLGAGAH